ncbi:MAG: MoaF N-terminal domain-containing protein [Xanthobacteraceae bacterium]|nr:MoaF N-terminal domain-containing protein [Xanthobacteraceae bacterium]
MKGQERPLDWKNDEDFAAGIDTNRLPPSTALAGREFGGDFEGGGRLGRRFAADRVAWMDQGGSGTDSCACIALSRLSKRGPGADSPSCGTARWRFGR